jgi:hypothetical protein
MNARILRTTFAALLFALAFRSVAVAAEYALPKTAADHEAMAKDYEAKAAEYRKVAADHREMAAAARSYEEGFRGNPTAASTAAAKMEKHCSAIMADADKLASDAESAAKFHHMRAQELKGK